MLEGYKPIDFSGVFPPMQLGQMRNRAGLSQAALNILANSKYSNAPISTLLGEGLNMRGEAPPRKQTLWGRAIDLLSTPAYMVANAADDALAGHQSDDEDSVLSDAGQIIGGIVTGAGRGIGTGLRGAFASSETAADPQDKQYLGDFLVRWDTHMSAEDAMKPENIEKIRARLADKKINMLSDDEKDKYFYDWDKGKVEVTDDDIEQYFKDMKLYGLGASMVADPINFVKGPTLFKGKSTAEVPEVISESKNTFQGFKELPKGAKTNTTETIVNPASMGFGKKPGSYKVKLAPGTIQNQIANPATGALIKPPAWFDEAFPPRSIDELVNPTVPVGPSTPANFMDGLRADPSDIITQQAWDEAIGLAGAAGAEWSKVSNHLRNKFNLSDTALQGIHNGLRTHTEPPIGVAPEVTTSAAPPVASVNELDPLDDILGSWASSKPAAETRDIKYASSAIPEEYHKVLYKFANPKHMTTLTGDLLRRMSTGNFDNALERIGVLYPGIPFNNTKGLISERFAKIPDFAKRLAIPSERKKILGALSRTIEADVRRLSEPPKVKTADELINEASVHGPLALNEFVKRAKASTSVAGYTSKNPTRDAEIIKELEAKFGGAIAGTKAPSQITNPVQHLALVASGKRIAYSDKQQVNVWNYLTNRLKLIKNPKNFVAAHALLRHFENTMMAKGLQPMSHHIPDKAVPLRLSQILDIMGPAAIASNPTLMTKILRGEPEALATLPREVVEGIEALKAGEAIVDGEKLVAGVEAGSKAIEDLIKGPISAARNEDIVTIGSKVADDIARMAGGSPVAGTKAAREVKETFIPKVPGDGFPATNTIALLSHPNVSPALLKRYSSAPAIDRAINKTIGGPTPRQLGKLAGPNARVVEWLGARFNAAYKNADMRPIYLRNAATAKASVALRAQELNNLAKKFNINDADLWNDALKAAQGRMATLEGTPAHALSQEIIKVMENLFGSSALKSSVAIENSVAGRSQLLMGEMNRNLRRFGLGEFQFTKKGDYAEGAKWLNSWESWSIDKPIEFLFKVQNVVEHTVREKIMFDDIVARFGSKVKSGEFQHMVNHPRLKGYYFGKDAAEQATQFVKNLKEISQTSSKTLQHFDKVLSKWKAGVTIYIPSHHIRNMIGDVYFNWLSGVNSTRPYGTAFKVMQSQRGRYEGIEATSHLTDPKALMRVMQGGGAPGAKGKNIALTMKNGEQITNDMVYVSAFQQGILPTTRVLEDIPDDVATALDKIKPLGGRGQKAAHTISEGRDHYVRLAHYIDALKKSKKPFLQASEDAAAIVRKWHPDGMDLTAFERNVMRRMFPFYSWTRKALPLIVESFVATPGKVMAYPKGQYLLQNMLGIETGPTMSDPFPVDQLFPDWIREKGIGPVMGGPGDYTVINPGNPTMDIMAQLNNPGKSTIGMINPAARIPFEMATGTEAQTGGPINSYPDYLVKQIPGLSHAGRATGEFGVSETTKENSQGVNYQNILNMLTAGGIQNTGPYIKSAEFDLRDYLKSLRG